MATLSDGAIVGSAIVKLVAQYGKDAPAEVEKRIQTVLQAPAMPESWERRRAR